MLSVPNTTCADGLFLHVSTIRRKLAAIIVGVSAAALVLAGVLIYFGQVTVFRRNMAEDLLLQARVVANNSLAAVSFRDSDDAMLVLYSLSGRASLAYAEVRTMDGEVLGEYRRDAFEDSPQSFVSEGEHAFDEDWLLVQVPVVLEGDTIGRVFLQSDLAELEVFRRHVFKTIVISLLTVFLLASIISFRLRKIICTPIEHLTEIVRDVSRRRDYSIRATHSSTDEIGVLANAFNEMLAEVELRDEQVKEREQRAQEYLNIAGVMIIALDRSGVVTLINPKGCEVLGCKEHEVLGKDWFASFVPASVRESQRSSFSEWVEGESVMMRKCENLIYDKAGNEHLMVWNISSIRDADRGVVRMLLSGEDVTEHRKAEKREAALREQLARAERMKSIGVLAGGVAHDLNNILGPLVALPECMQEDLQAALQNDTGAQAMVQESLGIMQESALRAASVVQDLLAVSRRGHYKRVPLDINKIHCLSTTGGSLLDLQKAYPHVTFDMHICHEDLIILGSEVHLCRGIDNLLRNAADAIKVQGTVAVTTFKKSLYMPYDGYQAIPAGDYAVIEVSDNGCGMEPAVLNRVFEPFYTQKKKTGRSGSGLGLSIVHGIVDDHEGYIDVESTPGVGTTFRLYFRLTDFQTEEKREDESTLVLGAGQVLVVDDEPGQRYLASSCLTRLGYTVSLGENGRVALDMFAKAKEQDQPSPYDLVILDMIMEPGFDGLDTLRAITELYPEQKVLIVSGHAENDRIAAALTIGAQWLHKPYSINDLASTVAKMLQREMAL